MRYRYQMLIGLSLCSLLSSGCSVNMALQGQKEPEHSVVKREAHRSDIEYHYGAPISETKHCDGTITAIYEYEVGREASAGRAIAHGVMDVCTLGIWEIIGTPVEAYKGDKMRMNVKYDRNEKMISAQRMKIDS